MAKQVEQPQEGTLIFVYNADAGLWNMALDAMHKVFSPKTYPCHLCAITYGPVSMRKQWRKFIEQLPIEVRFLHKDEWEQEFGRKDALPAAFLVEKREVEVFLAKAQMDQMDLAQLQEYVRQQLQQKGFSPA
ncbi:MAG: GTPase [Salibacteraceae bacterium]